MSEQNSILSPIKQTLSQETFDKSGSGSNSTSPIGNRTQSARNDKKLNFKMQQNSEVTTSDKEIMSNADFDFSDDDIKDIEVHNYGTTWYRWLYLFAFTFASITGSIQPVGLALVAIDIAPAYGVSIFLVNTIAISAQIAYIPMSFVSIWMYQHYKMSFIVRIACFICIFGQWFRSLSPLFNDCFWTYNVGAIISASYQPLLLTGTTTFCSAWFTEKERPFALAVSNLGTAAGNLLGFLISGYFFHGVPPDDKAAMRSANWHMTFFQNCLSTSAFIALFFIVRDKPKKFPSETATKKIPFRKNFCKQLFIVLQKRSFALLVVNFLISNGSYAALCGVISLIFKPFGYSQLQILTLVVCFIALGFTSALIFGAILGRTRKFVALQRGLTCTILCAFVCSCWIFPSQIFPLVLINMIIGGASLLPIVPVGIAFGQELTRPMHPGISTGTLLLADRTAGMTLTYIASYIATVDPENPNNVLIFFACLNSISALACIFIKEDFEPIIDKDELANLLKAEQSPDEMIEQNNQPRIYRQSFQQYQEQRESMMKSKDIPDE